ncbi:DUF1499 domain-containing protein [Pseudidiomarina terrestris]|uniref:DUF1499 domain-containing protein n=1 Tax=Pseudidiomarina terrestris TaxID=2820060 RepID=A0AAW7QXR1_9GAMM|nr:MULTISPECIES: DUF1499 domain-containing protein [unclassified Pseudidiomarina]MDN7124236.1 DUF1499 domain-containing protein [Pseudidiomarina sp. 1APP75-32.1]MDN7127303.1 DUF1499 domain-containing protein [Pseudidiomarina sp. 1APR75-33.1]MDN7128493.1 DUF1499 domain-containing protein [Pseudidiomarina sp. 1APR75-15]MDN7135259.1 DUF1499 domain-containing protein [Pseudidiomarina sp. 1ASP75-5]MDN7138682.1 DUF1499 domain-containing protein [Pseudidiomarina sp. 1ASP75-14]
MSKKIGSLLICLGFLSAFILLLSGPLYRWQILDLGIAFTLLRWAAYIGVASVVLIIVYLIWKRPRGVRLAVLTAAAIVGMISFYIPYQQLETARSVPPIHDITTDLENPPEFVAIAPLRADAPNPLPYPGEETAAQQRKAYSDLTPQYFEQDLNQVFEAALRVVNAKGWQLVASDLAEGRIEATASTFWFGFKDDVVIRLQREGEQTRVDVRSKSRVGRSDVGKNAARIRDFQQQLKGNL